MALHKEEGKSLDSLKKPLNGKTSVAESSLVIKVAPRGKSRTLFNVEAWLYRGPNSDGLFKPLLPLKNDGTNKSNIESCREEKLSDLFIALLKKVEDELLSGKDSYELMIEIFLPKEMFGVKFEEYMLNGAWLGKTFPVVLRSSDRIKEMPSKKRWNDRWNNIFSPAPEIKKLEDLSCCDSLHNELLKKKNEHLPCLSITTPLNMANEESQKIYDAIIKSGIPIALWPRCTLDSFALVEYIQEAKQLIEALWTEPLPLLPEKVREYRTYADDFPHHPGNYLVLLWDDPHKVPPLQSFMTTH